MRGQFELIEQFSAAYLSVNQPVKDLPSANEFVRTALHIITIYADVAGKQEIISRAEAYSSKQKC